ncbi:hypothetical protein [Parasutterella muris]|uniref:hypothetical protein n=1 Tax=Parasutterella muris TaxID=2565572 RepID=UPI0020410D15|nr:hypothetical protein [Parasutterella muris]
MNIELVKWVDTFGCPPGWEFEEDVEYEITTVFSVGFVKEENERMVVLIPHMSSAGRKQVAGYICIPRQQIIERKVISSSSSCQGSE